MPKLTRRTFLKTMAAGAVAAGCWEGNSAVPTITAETKYRLKDTSVTTSLCIHCSLGCGLLVFAKDGRITHTEGEPDNPNNEAGLCAKGASLTEVYTSPRRIKNVLYRAPYATEWQEVEWEWAIPQIAKRIKESRDKAFTREENGVTVNRAERIAVFGGSSNNSDENYLLNKFGRALGVVRMDQQARTCHSSSVYSIASCVGRGSMTNSLTDIANTDMALIVGTNPAEAYPGLMKFLNRAREKGATLIHVDPRYTMTSRVADFYAKLRPGTDIAFANGLVNYMLANDKIFKEYVVHYTNASYLTRPDYTFDDGHFSGWNEEKRAYDTASWDVVRDAEGMPVRDLTLQDPACVYQQMKKFYSRYTPEVVNKITGMDVDSFNKIAEMYSTTAGPDKVGTFIYSLGLTQHSHGVQNIRAYSILQLLLGNIGFPGGGINAVRGESNVQGSTDNSILYHSIPGYMNAPTVKNHDFESFVKYVSKPDSWWATGNNARKYVVSMFKAWWGDAATAENNFAYDYFPKRTGHHSYMEIFDDIYNDKLDGAFVMGMNPILSAPNASKTHSGLEKLDWMVYSDIFLSESTDFWKSPLNDATKIKTEVFVLPAPGPMEKHGAIVNTSRMIQFRYKAVEPLYDSVEDAVQLGLIVEELKKLYREDPNAVFPDPIVNLTWDYNDANGKYDIEKTFYEMNGVDLTTGKPLDGFAKLKDDGTTTSGNWVYCGMYDAEGNNLARRKTLDKDKSGIGLNKDWAWVWPMNRRILYNRASCDLNGVPYNEKKALIRWDTTAKRWTGPDVPDFPATRAPSDRLGDAPFFMNPHGTGYLFSFNGTIVDGPLPEHYESFESPVRNIMGRAQYTPPIVKCESDLDLRSDVDDNAFPHVCTTIRLTEHYQTGNVTRKMLHLVEAAPEAFIELDPVLAKEKGIKNGEVIEISSIRGKLNIKAFVTPRLQPYDINGKTVHVLGLIWNFGFVGEDPMSKLGINQNSNMLTAAVGDPNSRISEYKSFKVNVKRLG